MSALGDLSERLGKLAGPDREVDRLIHFHYVHPWLAEKAVKWVPAAFEPEGEFIWWTAERLAETGKEGYPDAWEPVTASLDASLALVEKLLPGWKYILDNELGNDAGLYPPNWPHGKSFDAIAPTMPIAVLLALFRALDAGGGG